MPLPIFCSIKQTVHDHEKPEVRIFLAEVDQGCRFASSGEGDDLDDVISLGVEWVVDDPAI